MARYTLQQLGFAAVAAGEGFHAYSAFLPSFFTVQTLAVAGNPSDVTTKVANLRSGYVPATLLSIGLGVGASLLAETELPLIVAGGASLVALILYEQALPPSLRLNPLAALLAGVQAYQTTQARVAMVTPIRPPSTSDTYYWQAA